MTAGRAAGVDDAAVFDAEGRMRPSAYYERIVDVMEELVRFTTLLRPPVATLTDRYSERLEVQQKYKRMAELAALATQ